MKLARVLAVSILISFSAADSFARVKPESCADCAKLAAIEKRAKIEKLKPRPTFGPLSTEAAATIIGMAKKEPVLDERRLDSVVSLFRTLVPMDKVHAVLHLTAPVLSANREALDLKIATLPKEEAESLTKAIDEAMQVPGVTGTPSQDPLATATPVPLGTPQK